MNGSLNRGLLYVSGLKQLSGGELSVKRFVQIDDHNDSGFDSDPKQRDVADPYSDAEVVAQIPLQQQASRHRVECRKNENQRFTNGMKNHVEQQEDREEYDRQNNL